MLDRGDSESKDLKRYMPFVSEHSKQAGGPCGEGRKKV